MIKQLVGKLQKKPSFKNSSNDSNSQATSLVSSGVDNSKASNGATAAHNSVGNNSKLNQGKKSSSKAAQSGNMPGSGYEALPSFREVPNSEKQNLFIRKLQMCCVVFDFSDPGKNIKEKDIKRQTLLELVDYISSVVTKFNEVAMQEITKMVATNLFRTFPSPNNDFKVPEVYDADEDELTMEAAWPHLQIVYELLLRFIASPETDAKLAKRFIDHSFVLRLLDLFDSEDQREREYLKTILHRIYGKFMVHRPYIRKAINNIFFKFIFETEKHNGIAELLEILGSIINGFALPLKEEHKLFLTRALIPLHKPKSASLYHQQLSYCIIQFVEKDQKLAEIVIKGLLKYWPVTNSSKEVLFLSELEEVLEATHAAEFQSCMVPLFRQLGRCLNSSHFQVAERALFLWNNDHIRNLIIQNRKVIVPIILPALERNTRGHWNQAVLSLTLNVRKVFLDADQELFAECLAKFQETEATEKETLEKRESTWRRLEDEAACKVITDETDIISTFTASLAISTDTNQLTTTGS